jgi:16S rRNA (cytosine967-C5)-methyltransferase
VELACILRLIVAEIFLRHGKKAEILRGFLSLASKNKKTIHSRSYIQHFINLSYKVFLKKTFMPQFELDENFRQMLLKQYKEKELLEMEAVFSKTASLDIVLKKQRFIEDIFEKKKYAQLHENCFRLLKNESINTLYGFSEGYWWVQNFSATIPVLLFPETLKNKNVLDICCAPGGKTFQLTNYGANVTAIDKSSSRLTTMKENLTRLGLTINLHCEDVLNFEPQEKYDHILLDPPCTSTGTIGKNPDLQFLEPLERLGNLLKLQENLLKLSSKWIRPNGIIIYSVCSLLREEGENQVSSFINNNKNFIQIHPNPSKFNIINDQIDKTGGLRISPQNYPEVGLVDGFYMAYLKHLEHN